MTDGRTDRQKDASDFVIRPMLCYNFGSLGTDNKRHLEASQVAQWTQSSGRQRYGQSRHHARHVLRHSSPHTLQANI